MVDTFAPTLPPQEEPTGDVSYRLTESQYGDGYRQIVGDGLNPRVQKWPLIWKGTNAEIQPIKDFFDAHIGVSFYYTPPNGTQGRYICKGYQDIPAAAGNGTVSATLEQTFAP